MKRLLVPVLVGAALALARRRVSAQVETRRAQYPPRSESLTALMRDASRLDETIPSSWAELPSLHEIVDGESDGWVGIPNCATFGPICRPSQRHRWPEVHRSMVEGDRWRLADPDRTVNSSAVGIGQLITDNQVAYLPNGPRSLGNPVHEALGMLRYIRDRYGDPDNAWAFKRENGWY